MFGHAKHDLNALLYSFLWDEILLLNLSNSNFGLPKSEVRILPSACMLMLFPQDLSGLRYSLTLHTDTSSQQHILDLDHKQTHR